MSYKVNIFYPFDKGFFGKTLTSSNRVSAQLESHSNLKLDSVDDMIKHFRDECVKYACERSPKADIYEPKSLENVVDFPNVFNL